MRRKDREITDQAVMLEAVRECDCVRIGLIDEDGLAYMVPVNFGHTVENGSLVIYFHGAGEGKKIDLIRKQPVVSFEMDCGHELKPQETGCGYSFAFKSIMGKGDISILEDTDSKKEAFKAIFAQYTDRKDIQFNDEAIKATAVFRLKVTEWSCKFHE